MAALRGRVQRSACDLSVEELSPQQRSATNVIQADDAEDKLLKARVESRKSLVMRLKKRWLRWAGR